MAPSVWRCAVCYVRCSLLLCLPSAADARAWLVRVACGCVRGRRETVGEGCVACVCARAVIVTWSSHRCRETICSVEGR